MPIFRGNHTAAAENNTYGTQTCGFLLAVTNLQFVFLLWGLQFNTVGDQLDINVSYAPTIAAIFQYFGNNKTKGALVMKLFICILFEDVPRDNDRTGQSWRCKDDN